MSIRNIIVVNQQKQWPLTLPEVEVVTAHAYLTDNRYGGNQNLRVFNLCRSYKYQSVGYYVSLLAEARGHRSIPDVATLQDFRHQALARAIAYDIETLVHSSLKGAPGSELKLNIYFGQTVEPHLQKLGKRLYHLFQAPLLQVWFIRNRKWMLKQVSPLPLRKVPADDMETVLCSAERYFSKKRFHRPKGKQYRYDLAILVNPTEPDPPSNKRALALFSQAANKLGFDVENLTKDDFDRLGEFDALFIRETTNVNHHTYNFARRAHAEGLIVVDDPWSILRCANKVYLTELLTQARIPHPQTRIIMKGDPISANEFDFPCVLKQPDSAFSRGVRLVDDPEELVPVVEQLFVTSDLVLTQEFLPSAFDWRVGILNRQVLFVCKYFMAQGHWQIYNWSGSKQAQSGPAEGVHISDAPSGLLELAMRAANLIGDGFYGVDIKQFGNRFILVEVNDNPSVDAGVEDVIAGDELYRSVMQYFLDRINQARSG